MAASDVVVDGPAVGRVDADIVDVVVACGLTHTLVVVRMPAETITGG